MATNPQFAATINCGGTVLSATQDSSYTAPTHTVTVINAGANGSKIEQVDFAATGTTVAGVIQLYLYDGSTYHAWFSQLVPVVAPSTTVAPWSASLTFTNCEIKSGWSLVATSFAANQLVNVLGFAGDL